MPNQTLVADIEAFVRESEERLLSVVRSSIRDTVHDAQTTTDKGGKLRYRTGFLSWSGRAAVGGWPSGPSERPKDASLGQYSWDGESLDAVLIDLKLGDTFFYGWTANYAETRELYDGFLGAAVQNWKSHVTTNTERLRKQVNGNVS